ncbi:hypothetical protein Q4601_06960 [Shewanella sp. 1_MG-2023]|uniref:hypothetical protein n=1 Tax=unclassified Shewanella TaxID=196818 RepID=UPI0026E1DD3C|nr:MULTISPECIES: hypothetical protein [unclassified Shewanella]MDO6612282.1 hypothetical protein [Shewanella sp. 7_MG-2023]MDO6772136.1 hypothetical protein [Shewanella sp. 2_MG-2023]MDO6794042.1 hypothetical protein [Shewanella sp. 1_MG-2023]
MSGSNLFHSILNTNAVIYGIAIILITIMIFLLCHALKSVLSSYTSESVTPKVVPLTTASSIYGIYEIADTVITHEIDDTHEIAETVITHEIYDTHEIADTVIIHEIDDTDDTDICTDLLLDPTYRNIECNVFHDLLDESYSITESDDFTRTILEDSSSFLDDSSVF